MNWIEKVWVTYSAVVVDTDTRGDVAVRVDGR